MINATTTRTRRLMLSAALLCTALVACGEDDGTDDGGSTATAEVSGAVSADGLVLSGEPGSDLEGAILTVPAGALPEGVMVTMTTIDASTLPPLPDGGLSVGPLINVKAEGDAAPSAAFTLKVPYDAELVAQQGQDGIQVKVWHRPPEGWALLNPTTASGEGATVSVEAEAFTTFGAGIEVP